MLRSIVIGIFCIRDIISGNNGAVLTEIRNAPYAYAVCGDKILIGDLFGIHVIDKKTGKTEKN